MNDNTEFLLERRLQLLNPELLIIVHLVRFRTAILQAKHGDIVNLLGYCKKEGNISRFKWHVEDRQCRFKVVVAGCKGIKEGFVLYNE